MTKLIIQAGRSEKNYWTDLWRYHELFYFLAWRDVLVRYKQTAIGVAWAIIRPLLTMLVLTIIFGRVAKMPSDGVPYSIMVLAGMLPWQFFSNALSEASNSLVSNASLISKVYFPRLVVPGSSMVVSMVDFLVSCVIFIAVCVYYRFLPDWHVLFLPAFVFLAFASALGPGLLITALNVEYRDFRYIIPFIVQFGLYVSPVGFSSNAIPGEWRLLYSMNPMVGVIDGFRWALCGTTSLYWPGFFFSLSMTGLFLAWGVVYFRRVEKSFADVI